jgi:hypothetical protein
VEPPIYDTSLPITPPNKIDEPIDNGYAKVVWSIDASVYALTHTIDSATAINLIVGLLAFSFLYRALRELGIDTYPAIITTFLAVVTTVYVEQLFTFREDAMSYEWLLIGVSSVFLLVKAHTKLPYFLCALTALVFLAGTKDSDLFMFLLLLGLFTYVSVVKKWYRLRSFKITMVLGVVIGFITLFNPYMTNIIRYRAVDCPFNQKAMRVYCDMTGYRSISAKTGD